MTSRRFHGWDASGKFAPETFYAVPTPLRILPEPTMNTKGLRNRPQPLLFSRQQFFHADHGPDSACVFIFNE
jgi:hypothetical protein